MSEIVRVLVSGYLKCPKCGNIDEAVQRGGILDGVFCHGFMEPVGQFVEMTLDEWRQKYDVLHHTTGWERHYQIITRN